MLRESIGNKALVKHFDVSRPKFDNSFLSHSDPVIGHLFCHIGDDSSLAGVQVIQCTLISHAITLVAL